MPLAMSVSNYGNGRSQLFDCAKMDKLPISIEGTIGGQGGMPILQRTMFKLKIVPFKLVIMVNET